MDKDPDDVMDTSTVTHHELDNPPVTRQKPDEVVDGPPLTRQKPDEVVDGPPVTRQKPDDVVDGPPVTLQKPGEVVDGPPVTRQKPDEVVDDPPVTRQKPDIVVDPRNTTSTLNQADEEQEDNVKPVEEKRKCNDHATVSVAPLPTDSSQRNTDSSISNFTIVLFGNSAAVQSGCDNILIGEKLPPAEKTELCMTVSLKRKISEHQVSVINMIDLHETDLNPSDHVISQLVNENEIHAFIFVMRLGQLTDADKMGIEWLQRMFGDKVLSFVMILFTYEREEESDNIIDELKKNPVLEKLIETCGQKYHICSKIMNNQSEMRGLMDRIRCLFIDNKEQCYTTEMYNTVLEDLQKNEYQSGLEADESSGHFRSQPLQTSSQSEKGDKQESIAEHLMCRLHLEGKHLKLKTEDFLQLTEHLQSHEICAEEKFPQTFLKKLLMMDYRAKCIKIKQNNEQNCHGPKRTNSLFHLGEVSEYPNNRHNKPII